MCGQKKATARDGGEYHGIIVDASLDDASLLGELSLLGTKKADEWTLCKVAVPGRDIESTIRRMQTCLKEGFYAHFYRGTELIVVFAHKVFRTTTSRDAWKDAIAYGASLGIPAEQLTFSPCRIDEETY